MNGRNRRRKDVPFNPFAQNAAAERNRRHAEKAKEKRRLDSQNQSISTSNNAKPKTAGKTLQDLQREAREKLGTDGGKLETTANKKEQQPIMAKKEPEVQKVTALHSNHHQDLQTSEFEHTVNIICLKNSRSLRLDKVV